MIDYSPFWKTLENSTENWCTLTKKTPQASTTRMMHINLDSALRKCIQNSLSKVTADLHRIQWVRLLCTSGFYFECEVLIRGAMAVGFGRQGLLVKYNFVNAAIVVLTLTAGSAFLMWIGERITEKGVGNGISIVLVINIISRIPSDMTTLFDQFVKGKAIASAGLAVCVIIAIILALVVFTVILQDGERRIAVQYSQKVVGRRSYGGQSTNIPLKVNTAGVIPIIFSSSLMQFPIVIATFLGKDNGSGIGSEILRGLNQSNWCNPEQIKYSWGLVLYIVLTVFFAYFYTSITFNPLEIANNMKKSGGFIPRKLIALRKSPAYKEVFAYGEFLPVYQNTSSVMAYYRKTENQRILITANFGKEAVSLTLEYPVKQILLSNMASAERSLPSNDIITLNSCEVLVFELETL